MNSLLLGRKCVSGVADKKLNDIEIGAILDAFVESRDVTVASINQSRTFKFLIVFINFYVLGFIIIYYFFRYNLLQAVDNGLMTEEFFIVFDGRAQIMFWSLVFINMGAYFNIGFRIISLIAIVYLLNTTVDNAVIFSGLVSFADRPYFSAFIVSRPIIIIAIAWMGLSYKNRLEVD